MIRLKAVSSLIDDANISIIQASEICKIPYNTMYYYYTGKRTPSMSTYTSIVLKLQEGGYIDGFTETY